MQIKKQIKNQVLFVEMSEVDKENPVAMQFIDMYRNRLGTVLRSYDKESKRFLYTALDHKGKPMFDKPFSNRGFLKQAVLKQKEQLLKDAHQRRLEAIRSKGDKSKESSERALDKPEKRKEELSKLRTNQSEKKDLDLNESEIEY